MDRKVQDEFIDYGHGFPVIMRHVPIHTLEDLHQKNMQCRIGIKDDSEDEMKFDNAFNLMKEKFLYLCGLDYPHKEYDFCSESMISVVIVSDDGMEDILRKFLQFGEDGDMLLVLDISDSGYYRLSVRCTSKNIEFVVLSSLDESYLLGMNVFSAAIDAENTFRLEDCLRRRVQSRFHRYNKDCNVIVF